MGAFIFYREGAPVCKGAKILWGGLRGALPFVFKPSSNKRLISTYFDLKIQEMLIHVIEIGRILG